MAAFFDEKRDATSFILLRVSNNEEIQWLSSKNKALLMKIAEPQEALLQEKYSVNFLQQEKIVLLESQSEREEKSYGLNCGK
ncbi:hypothetical protein SCB17_002829 [Clostridium perfringens]|nr:hypothetical protein [Clostridium perfringens]